MIQKVKAFVGDYTGLAHTFAGLATFMVIYFNTNQAFHDEVMGTYALFPKWAKTLVELGIAYAMWYRTNRKTGS